MQTGCQTLTKNALTTKALINKFAVMATSAMALMLAVDTASATPLFATQTGLDCLSCHNNVPTGRSAANDLNAAGQKFKDAGFDPAIFSSAPSPKPAPSPAHAGPSFACTGSLSPTEAVICSDAGLSALDRTLAAAYKKKLDSLTGSLRTALQSAEKTWIADRNSCGTNKSCINNAYRTRISDL